MTVEIGIIILLMNPWKDRSDYAAKWMTRLKMPMKGVTSCCKPRVAAGKH